MFTIEIHVKVNYSSLCPRREGICGCRGRDSLILSLGIRSSLDFKLLASALQTMVSIERR